MFGVIIEGIRVFSNLDRSYYLGVAIITILALSAIVITGLLFEAKGKLYKSLIIIGAIFTLIYWPAGIVIIGIGFLFRKRAISEQGNSKTVIRLLPNEQPQRICINDQHSGWSFDGRYYANALSSIKFPPQFFRDLELANILTYDNPGENCSIGYNSAVRKFFVTVYIYPAHSESLSDALRLEIDNIKNSHPDLLSSSPEEFLEFDSEIPELNLIFSNSTLASSGLTFKDGDDEVKSYLILTQLGENYIKLRASWPKNSAFELKEASLSILSILVQLRGINRSMDIFGTKMGNSQCSNQFRDLLLTKFDYQPTYAHTQRS
jgi:hypothetical protein